ncbi:MAG: hypothetical protein Q9227_003595 [Pyrenula ochraceoflavens]
MPFLDTVRALQIRILAQRLRSSAYDLQESSPSAAVAVSERVDPDSLERRDPIRNSALYTGCSGIIFNIQNLVFNSDWIHGSIPEGANPSNIVRAIQDAMTDREPAGPVPGVMGGTADAGPGNGVFLYAVTGGNSEVAFMPRILTSILNDAVEGMQQAVSGATTFTIKDSVGRVVYTVLITTWI